MTVGVDKPAELFQLDHATCMTLLATQHVGRLVLGGDDPTAIPLNYTVVDGIITFRTTPGSRAAGAAPQPVAFEVDMFDDRTRSGWSVVARGRLQQLPDDRERLEVASWAPGQRDQWMIVPVDSVSGRLLRGAVDAGGHAAGGYL